MGIESLYICGGAVWLSRSFRMLDVVGNFMKPTLYIISFIYSTLIFAQESKDVVIYIQKDSIKGHSQSIFFEKNKSSKYYKDLTSFTIDSFDKDNYNNSLDYLNKKQEDLIKRKTILPSEKWLELKQYKSKFYLYYPC
ncbi:MAG: hypothetical protein ACK43K_11385, partial [Chitinophagales bacterium]